MITFWPLIASSVTLLSSPRLFCRSRNPLRVYLVTNRVNQTMIGTTRRLASASQWLSTNMVTRMPTMESVLATREVTFCETAWLIASMSFVSRLMSPPAGCVSKNCIDRVCRCANRSPRITLSARWATRAMTQLATT